MTELLPAGMGKAPGGVSGSVEVQQSVRVGKLNLVDLAGSERVHVTGGTQFFLVAHRGWGYPALRSEAAAVVCGW